MARVMSLGHLWMRVGIGESVLSLCEALMVVRCAGSLFLCSGALLVG